MTAGGERAIRVRRPGALTTIQDCGRPGYAHLGVPRSGALDAPAHHRANRLAGNPPGAAVLETTLTGAAVTAECDVTAAVTGAAATVTVDGQPTAPDAAIRLRAGQVLDIGPARPGVRCYVAFSGGLAVPRVLGSASADLLSGLGPARLAAGDVLPLGPAGDHGPAAGQAAPGETAPGPAGAARAGTALAGCRLGELAAATPGEAGTGTGQHEPAALLIHPGPRLDWLAEPGLAALAGSRWTVSPHSNRVALRLAGEPVRRRRGELASEGLVTGGIQVPPDGQLVLFLADHPTTGGYPVVAVLDPASLPACAQARPGTIVSFRLA
ncbi:MAG TPA: biotin-dependent carboxyltransferase family protein [Streptosporangiaceae bacterium]|nr:biotin-dependent carboxyltransferase family protein [Streptosporangiaceae bacterium]